MAIRFPTLSATLVAGLLAAPAIVLGQAAPAPNDPPGTAAGRALDAVTGERAPDGTPGNPPGTAAGRAIDRSTGTNLTGANPPGDRASRPDLAEATPVTRASRIIGSRVYNDRNESLGEIEELILNAGGAAPTAVLSVGGFLGIGARLVAVPLSELRFNTDGERWVLAGATRDTLQQRPVFTYQTRS